MLLNLDEIFGAQKTNFRDILYTEPRIQARNRAQIRARNRARIRARNGIELGIELGIQARNSSSESDFKFYYSLGPVYEFVQYAFHLAQVISTVLG